MTGSPLRRAASISNLMYSRGDPALLTAGGAPALDRFQNGFRPLAAKRPIDIDDEQRRPLAESRPCAEPAGGEYRLVALGEEFVPDPLVHRNTSSVCQGMHPGPFRFTTELKLRLRPAPPDRFL